MKYNYDLPAFEKISEDAKDLIKKILVKADERLKRWKLSFPKIRIL